MGFLIAVVLVVIGLNFASSEGNKAVNLSPEVEIAAPVAETNAVKIVDRNEVIAYPVGLETQIEDASRLQEERRRNAAVPLFSDDTHFVPPHEEVNKEAAQLAGKAPIDEIVVDEDPRCESVANYAKSMASLKIIGVPSDDVEAFSTSHRVATFPIRLIQDNVYRNDWGTPDKAHEAFLALCSKVGYDKLLSSLKAGNPSPTGK